METQRVQFLEANGEWVTAVITDDSRVAHALLGAEGPVYDNLRRLYRYKPQEPVLSVEELNEALYNACNHVTFLLDTYDLWSPDGAFTFPDGQTYRKEDCNATR